jgi:signal transduction histidine kinase
LRKVREEIARMRSGAARRIEAPMPVEVMPLVDELNALIAHNERQAEEARRHAGNLAHALKTPLTVIMNAATAEADDLAPTVIREATTMRRQVDHHLARARAVGRRGHAHSRAAVWPSLESVERAVGRLYPHVRFDADGPKDLQVHVERQDLDEMLGNLIENAAKYGGGSVFVSSIAARGSIQASRERGSASRSCATWQRFTKAGSSSTRARIWAACWCGCGCRWRGEAKTVRAHNPSPEGEGLKQAI